MKVCQPPSETLEREQVTDIVELANYIGKNLVHLIDRDEDDAYCFRLHKDRYVWLLLAWSKGVDNEWNKENNDSRCEVDTRNRGRRE